MRTRTIRVKKQNQAAIMAALVEAGYTAAPCEAPLSQEEYYQNSFSSYEDWTFDSLVDMAGIETSASGKQANKVISALKTNDKID